MSKIVTVGMSMTAALTGISLAVAGCSIQAGDRAGGDTGKHVRVLSFAQAGDGVGAPLTQWAEQVTQLSRGTLRIDFKDGWRSGEPTAEAGIISDVGKRKVWHGWVRGSGTASA